MGIFLSQIILLTSQQTAQQTKTKRANKIGLGKIKQFGLIDWMNIQTPNDNRIKNNNKTKQTNIKKKSRTRSQYKAQHKNNIRQNKRGNDRTNNPV